MDCRNATRWILNKPVGNAERNSDFYSNCDFAPFPRCFRVFSHTSSRAVFSPWFTNKVKIASGTPEKFRLTSRANGNPDFLSRDQNRIEITILLRKDTRITRLIGAMTYERKHRDGI